MNLCTLDSGMKFCLMIYSIAYHPIWLRMLSSGEKSSILFFIVFTCGVVQLSFRKRIQKGNTKSWLHIYFDTDLCLAVYSLSYFEWFKLNYKDTHHDLFYLCVIWCLQGSYRFILRRNVTKE